MLYEREVLIWVFNFYFLFLIIIPTMSKISHNPHPKPPVPPQDPPRLLTSVGDLVFNRCDYVGNNYHILKLVYAQQAQCFEILMQGLEEAGWLELS